MERHPRTSRPKSTRNSSKTTPELLSLLLVQSVEHQERRGFAALLDGQGLAYPRHPQVVEAVPSSIIRAAMHARDGEPMAKPAAADIDGARAEPIFPLGLHSTLDGDRQCDDPVPAQIQHALPPRGRGLRASAELRAVHGQHYDVGVRYLPLLPLFPTVHRERLSAQNAGAKVDVHRGFSIAVTGRPGPRAIQRVARVVAEAAAMVPTRRVAVEVVQHV
mmetsp:Transcript_108119/g.312406  ORF Transcript_108119/g.312406 Transcript_108119/m.312406 type:complete len:219 (-) Transcript_108119:939-1595(-)